MSRLKTRRKQPKVSIRPVDPAEAETDPSVAYAFSITDEIDRRLAEHEANPDDETWVSPYSDLIDFDSWRRTARIPHERSAALGTMLHGLLCRTGGCDGSGGSSSVAFDDEYEGGHRRWVDAIPELESELRDAGIGLRTDEFHRIIPKVVSRLPGAERRAILGAKARTAALAALIHRHCPDRAFVPAGCGGEERQPCREAVRAARDLASSLRLYSLSLIDLRLARLVTKNPGPGDPRDVGMSGGTRD